MYRENNLINSLRRTFSWIWEWKDISVVKSDIYAWFTVAMILIPQSMAYANLAWLPTYVWLYAAFLPTIIWWFLSSSRQLSTWPVTVISLMTASSLAPLALSMSEYVLYASILAIMIGVIQLLLWMLKLWSIFNFLSHSVIIWFINAAALIIAFKQIEKLLWLELNSSNNFFWNIQIWIEQLIYHNNIYTILFWIIWIGSLYFLYKFFPKFPRFLFIIVVSTIISYLIWFDWLWWSIVWYIPSWLPDLSIPEFNTEIVRTLLAPALIIGFLGFTEAISIAKAVWLETKKQVSTNQMLYSEWMANITSWISGAYPISWTFSRTAVNLKVWAKTQFSSIIAWLIIAIVLIFFTKYLYYLPDAILSAVIIIAVVSLIKINPIIKAWKIQKSDAIVSIITFLSTIYFYPNLEYGIFIGVSLSIIFYLYESMSPRFSRLSLYKDWVYRDAILHWLKTSKNVWVYRLYGRLFFINIWYFENKIMTELRKNKKLKVIIIDFELIPYIDYSAMEILESIIHSLEKSNIKVYFAWVKSQLWRQFKVIGYLEIFGKTNVFPKLNDIILQLSKQEKKLDLESLLEYSPILRWKYKKID